MVVSQPLRWVFLLIFLGFWGCSEVKNPAGSGAVDLSGRGRLYSDTLFATLDTFYTTLVSTGASNQLLLGEYRGLRTRTLLKFENLPDSGSVIDSAALILYYFNAVGWDSSSRFLAQAYRVMEDWVENDTVNYAVSYEDNISEPVWIDPTADSLVLSIDTTLIQNWVNGDTTGKRRGLLIDFHEATFIQSFYSRTTSKEPVLRLGVRQPDTTFADSLVFLPDTTLLDTATADLFVLDYSGHSNLLDLNRLYLGHGASRRILLKLDIPDTIPPTSTINQALLELFVDQGDSANVGQMSANPRPNIELYRITSPDWPSSPSSVTVDSAYYLSGSLYQAKLEVNIHPLFQGWVRGDWENMGVLIKSYFDHTDVDQQAFYSSEEPDSLLRPRLQLIYSIEDEGSD